MNRFPGFVFSAIACLLLLSGGRTVADVGDAETVVFGRYPAPSPDGGTLAFSWAGSIWTVPIDGGRATRLTASDGYDWYPVWSPDGDRIAFMSDRYGSEDLFVIDARGGTPERISFASNADLLSGWLPDGSGLIFSSRRGGRWPDFRRPHIVGFESSPGEGPPAPEVLVPCEGYGGVMNPNGDLVAFEFGPGNGYRQGYRGTHKQDIWLYSVSAESFTRVTENDCPNTDPQWSADGSTLYYRSEEGGVGNVWSWDPETGAGTQITCVEDASLWNPKIGGLSGAEVVAYEWMGGLYVQELPDGAPREIRITAWLDEDPDTPRTEIQTAGATEYAISPDGNEMAFVVRGDIFCVRTDGVGGIEAAKLTNHPARDWEISWYPRGDAILFTSDRDGHEQLYRVTSNDPDHERLSQSRRFAVERLTFNDDICTQAVIAPITPDKDGAPPAFEDITIAYMRDTGDLWLMDGNGENRRKLFSHWQILNYSFSPDGRWIAYSRQDENYNVDIFIAAVDPDDPELPACPSEGWQPFPGGGRARGLVPSWADGEVNITRHPDDDWMPVWSPDGTKLGFTSVRNLDNTDAYFIFLQRSDEERSIEEWEAEAAPLPPLPAVEETEEEKTEEEVEEAEEADEEAVEEEEPFIVRIDFEDIHQRARRLTSGEGTETLWAFSPDGENIAYSSNAGGLGEIWQIRWTGENAVRLVSAAMPERVIWHPVADRIFYLSGGRINSNANGGGDEQNHGFSATIDIDPLTERQYKLDEVYRIEQRWFYDPDFHGQDWAAIRDEYEPIVLAARHYRDLNDAMGMMLGRLNSSHLSYSDAARGPNGPDTGYLGCGLVEDDAPGLLIEWITPHSPIDRVELEVEVGDRVVSINGIDVGGWGDEPIGNWWRALEGTVGQEIEIGILDADSGSNEPRWIRVAPTDYWGWYMAAYEEWMAENRSMVDELSGSRFGYLHVRNMHEVSMERFEQDLFTVGDGKNAIIVDVRWNSGGWTTDYLLAMLDTRRHAYTQPRDGGLGYPEDRTPLYTTTIPLALLINEYSYSNAEIFAHAIRTLGRGILVGTQTAGGVISMGGTRLADGSYISLPRRGWWTIDPETGDPLYRLEHNGAMPHIEVDLLPSDIAAGDDPQLEEAVAALMRLLYPE